MSDTTETAPTETDHREYLGDGVYADFNGFHVELRVNDHRSPLAVALEDTVAVALIGYIERKFGLRVPEVINEERPSQPQPGDDDKILDLMEALKASLAKGAASEETSTRANQNDD